MNVWELIEILEAIEDKDKPVYVYLYGDILGIDDIDESLSDRVDINAFNIKKGIAS